MDQTLAIVLAALSRYELCTGRLPLDDPHFGPMEVVFWPVLGRTELIGWDATVDACVSFVPLTRRTPRPRAGVDSVAVTAVA